MQIAVDRIRVRGVGHVVLVVLAIVVVGCGSETAGSDTTTSAAATNENEAYLAELVEAWERGDVDSATEYATVEVIDELFALEPGGSGAWSLQQCEGAAGSYVCTYAAGPNQLVFRMRNLSSGESTDPAVRELRVVTDD